LASCGAYETLRVWDAAPSDEMAVVKLSGGVRGLAFSPNGRTLAACGNSGVSLVDVDLGKVQTTLPAGATSIAFSHDGLRLALGREDRLVELWEMPGSRSYTVLKGHSEVKGFSPTVFSVAFSPDDRWLASAGYDGTVLVWDLATRNVRFTLRPGPNPGNPASAVAFSPDGRSLATGTLGENVRLWDAETGRELLVLQQIDREGSGPWCWSVAFSPDGGALATASQSGQVRLWDTATGRLSASLQGHTAAVRCVAFSPDGVTLATAANEPALRLWDTTTGQETIILTGHADRVSAVAFSRDGTLASGSPDGTVRFWRTSREPAAVARKTELNPDDPGSSAALIDSASRLTAAGRFLEAQQDYEAAQARVAQLTAVDLGKDSTPEAKYSLAEQCSQLGRSLRDKQQLELAARVFRHAISLREPLGEATPESRLAQANDYNDLAFTLKPAKRLQEAEAAVRTGKQLKQALVTEFPEKPEYRFHLAHSCLGLAYLFEESGRTSDALKAFAEADGLLTELAADASATEQLRQWVGQALRQLGDAWLRLNRVNDALDCFSKAILLQPDTSEAWTGRAWAHLHAQHWDQAVADYSKAIELSPQVHTNWFHRGHAHLQLQQWDKATVDFTRVVEGWPDEPGGWYLRALAYAQSSQPDKALSDLRQALAKGFQDAEQIKNDPRLEPLRSNDDFQKLLDELEAKKAATAKQ
jgi:WD40 repeat protein/regulator of sirC expression with transglutaminase-like and TPR domain